MAAALLALYAAAAVVGSVAPFYGGLSYNPEFDGLFMPIGLFAAYGSLYCFRRAFPNIPWFGEPSLDQGCLFSWLGFAVLGIVFGTLGAIRGNRSLDPGAMAFFWGVVLMPLALFWVVRRAAAFVRKR
jgi:hypothetical protein